MSGCTMDLSEKFELDGDDEHSVRYALFPEAPDVVWAVIYVGDYQLHIVSGIGPGAREQAIAKADAWVDETFAVAGVNDVTGNTVVDRPLNGPSLLADLVRDVPTLDFVRTGRALRAAGRPSRMFERIVQTVERALLGREPANDDRLIAGPVSVRTWS